MAQCCRKVNIFINSLKDETARLVLKFRYKQILVALWWLQKWSGFWSTFKSNFIFAWLADQSEHRYYFLSPPIRSEKKINRDLVNARFPALGAVYMLWLWFVLGSLDDWFTFAPIGQMRLPSFWSAVEKYLTLMQCLTVFLFYLA